MFSYKAITRLSVFFGIVTWCTTAFIDLSILFSYTNGLKPEYSRELSLVSFNLFLFSLYIFYKYRIDKAENINFIDLLWRVFVTGLVTTVISLIFRLLIFILGDSTLTQSVLFQDFIYSVNIGLLSAVLVACFSVFRRLILYQKSKVLITVWRVFQYSLLLSLLYNVLPFTFLDDFFNIYLIFLIVVGLFLSGNMKWVAYLNFRQKWKGILLVTLALFYLGYFFWTVTKQALDFTEAELPFTDFQDNIFLLALIAFVGIYTLFSLLVLLFNLPTSSVFEQKLEEVGNFQRLSQSIQTEQSEERVYDILLESSVSTVFADAAWLEFEHDGQTTYYCHKIDESEVLNIKDKFEENKVKGIMHQDADRTRNLDKVLRSVKGTRFRSLIAAPIVVKNQQIGSLALLKEVSDGFNREMQKIIATFANQAGISIENFRLLNEALQNERYKEELKIASQVQSSLLPDTMLSNKHFNISAYSKSAAEVGGDYYDTFLTSSGKVALIIGDVSGKGTSAAFHMSQMKGIFQSLSQLDLGPIAFLEKANIALSQCLDKASFITATYFVIDLQVQRVNFARAGHCPTLYYHSKNKTTEYFSNRGMGLGMLRNNDFTNYLEINEFKYRPGDIIVLYTDGITEAQNSRGEEYGYDRLSISLEEVTDKGPDDITSHILESFYEFTGSEAIDDDYTIVVVKFK